MLLRTTTLICAISLLGGCAAPLLVAGGAAATGVAVAKDRRTAGTMLDDERIELNILARVADEPELAERTHLNVTSYNGIVLLTGEVEDEGQAQRIITISKGVKKVREVKSALQTAPASDAASRSRDTLLTTRVKSRLVADDRVDSTAIKVVSEQRIVYLMGMVSPEEANAAVEVTRGTEGVMRIVKVFEYQH